MYFLFLLSQAFKIWMIIDAFRRRPDIIWWIVIFFVPWGEWIYFFVVKRHDLDLPRMRRSFGFERPPSVDQLRAKFKHSASLANKTELAKGLVRNGEHDEAITLFREVLARSEGDVRARLGLGQALLGKEEAAQAVEVLTPLVAQDPRLSNDDAWVDLVEARWMLGDVDAAIDEHRKLIRETGRIDVKLDLAQRLRDLDRVPEARELVEEALEGHQQQPAFVKRRDRAWAFRARKLRRSLAKAG